MLAIAAALALLGVLLFPSSSSDQDSGDPLTVSMVEMAFVPSAMFARPGQEVIVTNDGTVPHSLLVVGLGKGVELGPGGTAAFRLPDDAEGTFKVICDLPGHQEAGMVGTIEVSKASVTPAGSSDDG